MKYHNFCKICGRKLTDSKSKLKGIGPCCEAKQHKKEQLKLKL